MEGDVNQVTHAAVMVRPARPGDIAPMVELLGQLFSIECSFVPDAARQASGLAMMLQDDRSLILVAEIDKKVVGMVTVQIVISTAEGGRVGLIEDLVIDADHRGRGIGDRLLHEIESWSYGHGLSRLHLLADENNQPALDFYTHRHWKSTSLVCLRKPFNLPEFR